MEYDLHGSTVKSVHASPGDAHPPAHEIYTGRIRALRGLIQKRERWSRRISWARLGSFTLTLFLGGRALWNLSSIDPLLLLAALLSLGSFVALLVWHDGLIRSQARFQALAEQNEWSLARVNRDWARIPSVTRHVPDDLRGHPLARDLDVFPSPAGGASLFGLAGQACSPVGLSTLARWLMEAASGQEIGQRQEAAGELAPHLDWRQELNLRCRSLEPSGMNPEPFLAWVESEPWLLARPIWLGTARALTALTVLLLVGHLAGPLPPIWPLFLLLNLVLTGTVAHQLEQGFSRVTVQEHLWESATEMFRWVHDARFDSPRLRGIQQTLSSSGEPAHVHIGRLARLAAWSQVRRSGPFYLAIQGLLLWDFHLLARIERWKQRTGPRVRQWYAALGEMEALSALAGLGHDHPHWSFPVMTAAEASLLEAKGVGHPLLPASACVVNDVAVGPIGSFLLVTGSNMSGKSTLLRALGLNVLLAQAGGPVFARSFSCPKVALATSFRIQDSVTQGVSFFMAELTRLKEIVEQAKLSHLGQESKVLYLLDEILQGTNVVERQVAVRRVIAHLIGEEAIGAVSTHDLSLADAPDLQPHCRPIYFTESYVEEQGKTVMRFDYLLRPGVAPTTNALRLMEMIGLIEPQKIVPSPSPSSGSRPPSR